MIESAALLIVLLGAAHSYLGERHLLIRLFRRDDLPKLFGGTDFTRRTLRFAWHLTTVLAFLVAHLLLVLRHENTEAVRLIGYWLIASAALPLIHTRGRHLSWLVLAAAGLLCVLAR